VRAFSKFGEAEIFSAMDSPRTKRTSIPWLIEREELIVGLKSKLFAGRITVCAIAATATTLLYSLCFASLFLPPTGEYRSLTYNGSGLLFLAIVPTVVLALIGGRKGGTGRTVGVLCGVILIALPTFAVVIASILSS